jgi:hypothetical protein
MPLEPTQFFELTEGRKDLSGVFVLGCFEHQVSIRHQQVRALNLIYSLCNANRLNGHKRIAIIGGGFAGLTAAAAALWKRANVDLFDENQSLLWMQRSCKHRWLHPNMSDWPDNRAREACAGLPFLDWEAGWASEVVQQIDGRWENIASKYRDILSLHLPASVKSVEPLGQNQHTFLVKWTTDNEQVNEQVKEFDYVILAVGFGTESPNNYWEPDDLDSAQGNILISGCGDGGLSDLFRLLLYPHRYDQIIDAQSPEDLRRLRARIVQIEKKGLDENGLAKAYDHLTSDSVLGKLDTIGRRINTNVTLNGKSEHPYSMNTPSKRFIAWYCDEPRLAFNWPVVRPQQTRRPVAGSRKDERLIVCNGRRQLRRKTPQNYSFWRLESLVGVA